MTGLATAWWLVRAGVVVFGLTKLVAWAWIMGPSWVHEYRSKRVGR